MKNLDSILKFITGRSESIPINVKGTPRLAPQDSLKIYKTDYFCRLQGVLGEHFPMTWKIMGDEQFHKFSGDYVLKNPSQSWDINIYGHEFPLYLKTSLHPIVLDHFPFLPDLAQLEWAHHEFFHSAAEANPVIDIPASEEQLGELKLATQFQVFTSPYQITNIYRAVQRDESLLPEHWKGPSYYFLSKKDFQVHLEELNETQYRILATWKKQGSFASMSLALEDSISADDPILNEFAPVIERMIRLKHCGRVTPS